MATSPILAPDIATIETIARAVLARLRQSFGPVLDDIVFRIAEFAEKAVLDELNIDDPFALSGLYTGRPIGEKSLMDSGTLPDIIHLYRRPLLDEWVESGESLEALIAHVMIHEVGHHFGLSDEDMHALEAEAE
jgi:predicted Zn-dependent protease with MMP-like domain